MMAEMKGLVINIVEKFLTIIKKHSLWEVYNFKRVNNWKTENYIFYSIEKFTEK